jgi:hypothetical protein
VNPTYCFLFPVVAQLTDPVNIIKEYFFINDEIDKYSTHLTFLSSCKQRLESLENEKKPIECMISTEKSSRNDEQIPIMCGSLDICQKKMQLLSEEIARCSSGISLEQNRHMGFQQDLCAKIAQKKQFSLCMMASHLVTLVIAIALSIIGVLTLPLGLVVTTISALCLIGRIDNLLRYSRAQSILSVENNGRLCNEPIPV